ncbi:hypothetical protein OFN61_41145, partial [Escherichia coli]|nr:hypothetical protein [Escherichia coli]
ISYGSESRNLPLTEPQAPDLESVNDFFPVTYDDFTTELAIGIQPTLWQELRFGARYSTGDIELSTLASAGKLDFERR